MWTDDVRDARRTRAASTSIAASLPEAAMRPRVITLGIETSCDETAVAVVEDGFDRALEPDRLAGAPARTVRRGRARGGRARARRGVEPAAGRGARRGAGVGFGDLDAVAVTVGPGLVGALLVGMAAAKAVALATGATLVGREPPRGTLLGELPRARAARAALRRADRERRATRCSSTSPRSTTTCARPDARRCGGGGLRQGGAADRARVPGRAGARRDGARGRPHRDPLPAGDGGLGRSRLLDERAEDGGAPLREAGTGGRPRPPPPGPGRELPGGDRRRAGRRRRSRRQSGPASARCCSAAAWSRTRACASACAPRARLRASRVLVPAARPVHRQRRDDRLPRRRPTRREASGRSFDIAADPQLRLAP